MTAVNAAEVLDQLVRGNGRDADDVHADLALLAQTGMQGAGTSFAKWIRRSSGCR